MTFDTGFFLQTKGNAMGTIFVPTYATIAMGHVEIELYKEVESGFGILINNI